MRFCIGVLTVPIECSVDISPLSRDAFYEVDYEVMRLVFAVHGEAGRLCDEKVYQNELAFRCSTNEFKTTETEVQITLVHGEYRKPFYADLLIDRGALYELKAADAITPAHQTQALNYLLLLGLQHGKALNMRTQSVQHRFVSTRLTQERRRVLRVNDQAWKSVSKTDGAIKDLLVDLCSDWGLFLSYTIYRDALIFFLGGKDTVVVNVELCLDERVIGTQKVSLLDERTGFRVTAASRHLLSMERNLQRFLDLTPLRAIQWMNLNHHDIILKTLIHS